MFSKFKNMINIWIVLAILLVHWIADTIFQDEKWAINKWNDLSSLLAHTITYTFVFAVVLDSIFIYLLYTTNELPLLTYILKGSTFLLITFVCHTITDYYTSKINHKLYIDKKLGGSIPNFGFFTMVLFDQLLHYIQLLITYLIIFG